MNGTISCVLIVQNEAQRLGECLQALNFCDEIVVVDGGSDDGTPELARRSGARVLTHPFADYASQKNFAIAQASGDWVLLIDADEIVSQDLACEIVEALKHPVYDAYWVKRQNRIFGRLMKRGANANDWQLRLVKKDRARFEGRVHERVVWSVPSGRLKNILRHQSTGSIRDYLKKLNHYTALEARQSAEAGRGFSRSRAKTGPLISFLYFGFLKHGAFEGVEGFIFSVLSAYYDFVKRVKHWEIEHGK